MLSCSQRETAHYHDVFRKCLGLSPLTRLTVSLGLLQGVGLPLHAESLDAISTGGHTVYQMRRGRVQPQGQRVLFRAELDGTVACYTAAGDVVWMNRDSRAMPLGMHVADLDGDGRDEALVAFADGGLCVFDQQGEVRWRFSREPPLLQVCAVSH